MNLNLIRPLAFIDLETTGIDVVNDRIVQIAVLKVLPNGKEIPTGRKINPTIPIPPAASKIHGIYDADVQNEPSFADIAENLANFISDSDIAGYNSNKYDIPLLLVEFYRAGIDFKLEGRNLIDVQTIFHKMEPRNLKAAYKFYCGKNLVGAHDAVNDTRATYEIFKAQIQRYENVAYEDKDGNIFYPIENHLETLAKFTPFNLLDPTGKVVYDEQGREIFNFGKHRGKTLVEVFTEEPTYYYWIMNKDFSIFTKRAIEKVWRSMNKQTK
ncbi:MAG: 3'-5' exonuclease [Stigonema ocellatum SAG 48.90 = DSM 106950]|nr:3'-5' exonuclease [Stigonema ocellatum SAG 48.90 = DSM 106950]